MEQTIRLHRIVILFIFLFVLFAGITVCRLNMAHGESVEKRPIPGKLLVLPFHNMVELYGDNRGVRCPICGKVFITGKVSKKAVDYLSDKLVSMIRQKKYYNKMVTSDSQWGDFDLSVQKGRNLSERDLLMAAGRSAGATAVMVGYVYRFRQRIGSKISVDTPASVAFGLHLIDVKTGKELWKGHVDETQKSLSEDLFKINKFVKRKASWVTAEEMADSGLKEILKTLPEK